jgi:hypothetical protein
MEKVAFIGGYDKMDLILYISKILTVFGKKVLIIDTTTMQKSRYIIPVMTPAQRYITTYQDIDVAVGLFKGFEDIKSYLSVQELDYDYVLLDIDNPAFYQLYQISPNDKHFFVTSFDLYNLRKGLNALTRIQTPVHVIKVLFTKYMSPDEDEYLNYLSKNLRIEWDKDIVYFPFETADLDAIFVNQRKSGISLTGLSSSYVDSVLFLTEIITNKSPGEVRKAAKNLL